MGGVTSQKDTTFQMD